MKIMKMPVLRYFKRSRNLRPDPKVPLNKELDSYTVRLVNEEVKPEVKKSQRGERGPFVKLQRHRKRFYREKSSRARTSGYICHFSGK